MYYFFENNKKRVPNLKSENKKVAEDFIQALKNKPSMTQNEVIWTLTSLKPKVRYLAKNRKNGGAPASYLNFITILAYLYYTGKIRVCPVYTYNKTGKPRVKCFSYNVTDIVK